MKYYRWGSWLFLLGSICFTIDALVLCFDELTIRSFFYLFGCILFSLGCVCFTIDAQ
ncbi:MAG: hypothetical protein ABEI32_15655 [Halothece sp.]